MEEKILLALEKGNILTAINLLPNSRRIIALGLYGEYIELNDVKILKKCLEEIQVVINQLRN